MTGSEWASLGALQKYAFQVIVTLLMPQSISNINYVVVGIGSLLLIIAMSLTVSATKGMPMRGLKVVAVLGSLCFVVLFLAPFVVNFGNGFRLRLMVWAVVAGAAMALLNTKESVGRQRSWAVQLV